LVSLFTRQVHTRLVYILHTFYVSPRSLAFTDSLPAAAPPHARLLLPAPLVPYWIRVARFPRYTVPIPRLCYPGCAFTQVHVTGLGYAFVSACHFSLLVIFGLGYAAHPTVYPCCLCWLRSGILCLHPAYSLHVCIHSRCCPFYIPWFTFIPTGSLPLTPCLCCPFCFSSLPVCIATHTPLQFCPIHTLPSHRLYTLPGLLLFTVSSLHTHTCVLPLHTVAMVCPVTATAHTHTHRFWLPTPHPWFQFYGYGSRLPRLFTTHAGSLRLHGLRYAVYTTQHTVYVCGYFALHGCTRLPLHAVTFAVCLRALRFGCYRLPPHTGYAVAFHACPGWFLWVYVCHACYILRIC